jgi:hypothetical protein
MSEIDAFTTKTLTGFLFITMRLPRFRASDERKSKSPLCGGKAQGKEIR